MNKVTQQMLKRPCIITIFVISVLSFSLYRAQAQTIPSQNEGTKGHPKIESGLTQLLEEHTKRGVAASQEFAKGHGIKMDQEGMITVYLLPEAGKTKDTIDVEALGAYGDKVIKSGDYVLAARVPVSKLNEIADNVKGISFIKLPDEPHGDVISEGVNLTGAAIYYSSGYDGQNVKVAIIDSGFANLSTAIANGVLPSTINKIDCTGTSCVPSDFALETGIHGTACAEIVRDMAPSAQLYLLKISNTLDLKQAKDYCLANGIAVVSHSLGWVNSNFYDGSCYNDNPVCTANNAFEEGILWVNSAGNFAQRHYEAIFSDPDGNGSHHVSGNNECINITAKAGDTIRLFLTWDAWPVTNQDYDLYLFYNGSSGLTQVASSRNLQTGTQPPTESIAYTVPSLKAGNYCVGIKKDKATTNNKFEMFSFSHDFAPYVPSSSISSPADASGAMAVAAIDWHNWTTGPQEYFSSQGPTTDGRVKPEISGPDAVSNYILNPFYGTSAAAPHVAGAAAMVLSNNPSYNVTHLWNALTSSAIGMGSGNIYGWGRLNLPQLTLKPNLTHYQPSGWSDKIVVSNVTGTNTDSSPLYSTDTLYVDWAVTNNGAGNISSTFWTALFVDGIEKTRWSTNTLNSGNYIDVNDYPIGSLSAGAHTLKVVTDVTGVIDETNESDNDYTKTITVQSGQIQKPNLTPYQPLGWSDKIIVTNKTGCTPISCTDSSPLYTTDTLYTDWAVINNGSSPTPATFTIQLYVDGVAKSSWNTNPPLNSSYWVFVPDYSIGSLSAGTHTIKIVADSNGVIDEGNESDNEYIKTITVLNPPEVVSSPSTLSGPISGSTEVTYPYSAGGSASNLGHPIQYRFDWGDGTFSDWSSSTNASKSWSTPNTYSIKAQARCATDTSVVSSWSSGLTVNITESIILQSPSNGEHFNDCSLYSLPTFSWMANEAFKGYQIQFATDNGFSSFIILKTSGIQITMTSVNWKKVLLMPGVNGGTVYWRVVGTRADRTTFASRASTIIIDPSQPVENASISPTSKGSLPTLSWQNNCNIKFKVWFGNGVSFNQKTGYSFTIQNPNGGDFLKALTSGQWKAIRKLVGDTTGSPIYWYVESWDKLNRDTVTGNMSFVLMD